MNIIKYAELGAAIIKMLSCWLNSDLPKKKKIILHRKCNFYIKSESRVCGTKAEYGHACAEHCCHYRFCKKPRLDGHGFCKLHHAECVVLKKCAGAECDSWLKFDSIHTYCATCCCGNNGCEKSRFKCCCILTGCSITSDYLHSESCCNREIRELLAAPEKVLRGLLDGLRHTGILRRCLYVAMEDHDEESIKKMIRLGVKGCSYTFRRQDYLPMLVDHGVSIPAGYNGKFNDLVTFRKKYDEIKNDLPKNDDTDHFNRLPDEMLVEIFSALSHKSRTDTRLVCKRFNQVMNLVREHNPVDPFWISYKNTNYVPPPSEPPKQFDLGCSTHTFNFRPSYMYEHYNARYDPFRIILPPVSITPSDSDFGTWRRICAQPLTSPWVGSSRVDTPKKPRNIKENYRHHYDKKNYKLVEEKKPKYPKRIKQRTIKKSNNLDNRKRRYNIHQPRYRN